MTITKVTLVGANGKLGPSILRALQDQSFTVTLLVRASSKSKYPDDVTTKRVSDSMEPQELVDALRGQDALVLAFNGSQTDTSIKLANAALEARVKRIIPADFGSCDSSDPHSLDIVPLYREKEKVRNHLIKLSRESNGALTWTSLITGHFLDYGLASGLLQFDLKEKKATIFDGGDIKWSATTLDGIALAVVKVLQHEAETKDKIVYVQSLSTTQNELLKTVEKITGQKFMVNHTRSEEFVKKYKAVLAEDGEDGNAIEELVSVEGTVNADWEKKDGFANDLLGMPQVNLEDVVRNVVHGL